jgi:hypothetical protein
MLGELREWGAAWLARYKLPTVLHIVDARQLKYSHIGI